MPLRRQKRKAREVRGWHGLRTYQNGRRGLLRRSILTDEGTCQNWDAGRWRGRHATQAHGQISRQEQRWKMHKCRCRCRIQGRKEGKEGRSRPPSQTNARGKEGERAANCRSLGGFESDTWPPPPHLVLLDLVQHQIRRLGLALQTRDQQALHPVGRTDNPSVIRIVIHSFTLTHTHTYIHIHIHIHSLARFRDHKRGWHA